MTLYRIAYSSNYTTANLNKKPDTPAERLS